MRKIFFKNRNIYGKIIGFGILALAMIFASFLIGMMLSIQCEAIEVQNYYDFDDGETGSIVKTSHTYYSGGVNSAILTNEDNFGVSDSTIFDVIISGKPNTPPKAPSISGTKMGTKGEFYDYTFMSIDEDGDDLQYFIEWSDESSNITDFYPNATEVIKSHRFSEAGIYFISAHAFDNQSESETTDYKVLIDVWWVKEIGLFIDEDANGVYEKLLSNSTGELTDTKQRSDGKYLIDSMLYFMLFFQDVE